MMTIYTQLKGQEATETRPPKWCLKKIVKLGQPNQQAAYA